MSKKLFNFGNTMMKTKFGVDMIFFPGIYTKVVTMQCDETDIFLQSLPGRK